MWITVQRASILVSVINCILTIVYFGSVSYNAKNKVSNNLQDFMGYRVAASILVCLQGVFLILFFKQFLHKFKDVSIAAIVLICVSLIGWIVLVSEYKDPVHVTGFAIFAFCNVVYWVMVFYVDNDVSNPVKRYRDDVIMFLFVLSVFFLLLYCILYFVDDKNSWVYEHLAVIVQQLAYIVFFWYHNVMEKQVDPPKEPQAPSDVMYKVVITV
jgi:hypothetical protein